MADETRTQHPRVTARRTHQGLVMGMHQKSSVTHAGATTHFDVSYLTKLGQQGADLAKAILQNCERDYTTLQQVFGGLTPHRLPFVVQITSDSTGASHSSCMGTDIAVGGKSDGNVDFIRSLATRNLGISTIGQFISAAVLISLGVDGLFLGRDIAGAIGYDANLDPGLIRPITIGLIVIGAILWSIDRKRG